MEKHIAMVPMIFVMIGMITMFVSAGSTLLTVSGVSLGAGPIQTTVIEIAALSASLIFAGLVVFIVGVLSLVTSNPRLLGQILVPANFRLLELKSLNCSGSCNGDYARMPAVRKEGPIKSYEGMGIRNKARQTLSLRMVRPRIQCVFATPR